MEVAAAASVQNDGTNWSAALSRARSATMCVLSLLFAWLANTTLRHIAAGDEKEKDRLISAAVLRGLSPLIWAYLFSLTVALQGVRGAGGVSLRVTCLLLLAAAVANLIGPSAGAAAMFLTTIHSAATLGGALAVRRQKAGTEVTAATAAMSSAPYRSRAEEQHVQSYRTCVVACTVFVVAVTFGSMALTVWLGPPEQHEESHVGQGELELFSLMIFVGPLLTVMRQLMLDGNPLQVEACTFGVSMVVGILGWIVAMVVANVLVGGNALAIVIWAGGLAMAGFFGYGRAVEAEYEQLMAVKRSEPRTAVDASGLLVGRDEEDACSAHIDASTSLCLDCAVRPGCHC